MSDEPTPAAPPGAPATIPRQRLQRLVAGLGRIVSEEGIDTGEYVTLGGARQWITLRGQDRSQPLLLYLHGGPGGAVSHWGFMFQRSWEEYFTVVHWDQRGFGRSNIDGSTLDGTLHKDQVVSDTIELIRWLLARFGQRKLILVGQSWGSLLGLEVAKRAPELLHVLATIGQVTAWDKGFELTRRLMIQLAERLGDPALGEKMAALGDLPAPPDEAARFAWISTVQNEMFKHGHAYHNCSGDDELGSRIETLVAMSPAVDDDYFATMAGDTTQLQRVLAMTASLAGWEAERNVGTRLEVPYVIFQGRFDWQTPTELAREWFDKVDAPWKRWIEMPRSAHYVVPEEPGRMIVELHASVLPAARGEIPPGAIVRPR